MGILEDMERQRQMLDAQAKARMAQEDYNRSQEAYSAAQNNTSGGGLADVLKSAWNGITSGATSLWNAGAGAVNAALGGMQTAAHRQHTKNLVADASNKRNEIARKYGYNSYSEAMNDDNASQAFWDEIREANSGTADKLNKSKENYVNSDTYKNLANMSQNKYGADAIRGENFLADVLTADMGGGLAKAAGINAVQGALGGIADQLENTQDGQQFDWGEAGKRALSSAAGGAADTLAAGSLGRAAGGSNLGRILGSNVGRGALSGAASGAVSAGTQTALDGGDLGQVLSNAWKAGGTGAMYGGITSGAMGLANRGFNKLSDAINKEKTPNVLNATTAQEVEPVVEDNTTAASRRQKAVGWDDNEIDASKRNKLQTIGKELQDAGERTKNADVYGRLNNNTARDVDANDTINRLQKEYGYAAKDYDRAANLSEATNKWISNELKSSGASGFDHDLVNRTAVADVVDMTDKQLASYNKTARQLLNDATVGGGAPGEYSAAGLYEASEKAGKLANTYYEKAHNKMDGSVINPALDELSEAYRNLKNQTRAAADNMVGGQLDDVTRNNLTKMLKDSGAPEAAVKTLSNANSFSELKRLTSPLEQARNMSKQMHQTMLKRGATTDNSRNPVNVLLNKSGATQALDAALSPVGRLVGGAEQVAGKVIGGLGDIIAGNGVSDGLANKITSGVDKFANSAVNTTNVANSSAGNLVSALTNAAQRNAIRQNAIDQAGAASANMANQGTMRNAQSAMDAARSAYDAAQQDYTNAQAMATSANAGMDRLDQITRAMDMALAAGDLDSYSKLASLYQTAYKIYAPVAETASPASSLNATQQGNLAKLESAGTAINQLEQLYNQAGGAQGRLGGSLAQFGGALGINSGASVYENAARGLINQIAAAVGKTDSLNTEGEVQRALDLVPKITDTPEEAQAKLQSLRSMLNANKQTYQNIYGVAQ